MKIWEKIKKIFEGNTVRFLTIVVVFVLVSALAIAFQHIVWVLGIYAVFVVALGIFLGFWIAENDPPDPY